MRQNIPDLVDRGADQPADDLHSERSLRPVGHPFDQRNELPHGPGLFRRQPQAGMHRDLQEKRHHTLSIDADLFQQTGRDMDDMTPEMPRRMDLDYVFRSRYEQGVFLELVFAQVERHGRLAFGSHADNEGIDPARIAESLHHRSAVRREAGAHQPEPAPAAGHRKQIVQGETRDRSLFVYLVHLTVRRHFDKI